MDNQNAFKILGASAAGSGASCGSRQQPATTTEDTCNLPMYVCEGGLTIWESCLSELVCLHNIPDHCTYHIKKSHRIRWQHFDKGVSAFVATNLYYITQDCLIQYVNPDPV